MAKEVARAGSSDFCFLDVAFNHFTNGIGVKSLAVATEKESGFLWIDTEIRSDFVLILNKPFKGGSSDGNHSVFIAFSFADLESLSVSIEVLFLEANQFTPSDTCAVE